MATKIFSSSLWVGCLIAMSLTSVQGQAFESISKGGREPAQANSPSRRGAMSSVTNGVSDGARKQIYRDLLSAETPQLSWPAFPRIWMERTKTEYVSSNTSLGLQVPVLDTGVKLSINYRYGLKTTLVIMSSLRRFNGVLAPGASIVQADANSESTILRWDEQRNLAYPDVKDDYPMVGFCSYEASLTSDTFKRLGFEIAGNGQAFEQGTVETGAQTLFSNFFQVRGDISVRAYLEDVCGRIFKENIQKAVISDFSKIVLEKVVHDNPNSECTPPNGGVRDALVAETGDVSCLEWHAQQPDPIRKITVPRCEMRYDGAYRCVARARANTACSMYMDAKTGKRSETYVGRKVVRLTPGDYEYKCDGYLGLKCEMVSEPTMVFGQPFLSGKAICKSAY